MSGSEKAHPKNVRFRAHLQIILDERVAYCKSEARHNERSGHNLHAAELWHARAEEAQYIASLVQEMREEA